MAVSSSPAFSVLRLVFISEVSEMKYLRLLRKLCWVETRRWLLMVGLAAVTYLSLQSLLLPYGEALRSLLADEKPQFRNELNLNNQESLSKPWMTQNPVTVQAFDVSKASIGEDDDDGSTINRENPERIEGNGKDGEDLELFSDGNGDLLSVSEKIVAGNDRFESNSINIRESNVLDEPENIVASEVKMFDDNPQISVDGAVENSSATLSLKNRRKSASTGNDVEKSQNSVSKNLDVGNGGIQPHLSLVVKTSYSIVSSNENTSILSPLRNDNVTNTTQGRKKMKCEMPPKTVTSIDEMNRILERHRRSSRAMKPKWPSVRDQEILAAKFQIEKSPVVRNDPELYAPLFRNVSMFKRSYELMERTLKVYVYKEGNKPIFHQPTLKGLYASEGWFMKLMEGNKIYSVQDPRKAHLFYMPFSSRMLEHVLYVQNSHNRSNLRQYMKDYTEKISAKYPYFNRTGGADHFLVACHDWAPYETRHHMERCMKALCNADVTIGFKIGRDVSFPETYVRSGRNPKRDLGGKPPSQRHIFAFYAGNMHGYLRPILLHYWKDKDPDMKILGPMPPGVSSKMSYIEHMKSSKYCICPKGYEVNSPRVVEAIFYECVPVIISDNFVPPFFDVLDWSAFSVIMAEREIPRLKEILDSIPEKKYLEMQLRVRKVQRHFLWHAKPLKYDLFHMTLHSIWYNRVFQIKLK